jgi:hypothetical protein
MGTFGEFVRRFRWDQVEHEPSAANARENRGEP